MRKKRKSISKAGKLLCLMLAVVLTLGAMPVYGTFASAGTDESAVETASETPAPSVEPDTPEPAAAPAPQGEPEVTPTPSTEVTPSGEPEASPTPGETPTESPEPSESATATYENSISGTLWLDMFDDIGNSIYAGDGTRQVEESPLAGYTVELYKANDTDNTIASTTTGADGKYSFINIEPGSYVVGVKTTTLDGVEYLLPLFWLDGTTGDNRFVATYDEAADAYLYAYTAPIMIAEDSEVTGMDAGMRTVPGIQPMAAYTINLASPASVAGVIYSSSSNTLTFTTAANGNTYTITGTTTTVRIVVQTGVTVDITLSGASMTHATYSPFQLQGTANVNLTLADGTTNSLTCLYATTMVQGTTSLAINGTAGLYVMPSATLTIDGTGALTAISGFYGAGIGGTGANLGYVATNSNAGTISINGGTIAAQGRANAAGIGGGNGGSGGTITINGGIVTAQGGSSSAGIGGGGGGSGGAITINGGTVTAQGGSRSPGIGGGGNAGTTGDTPGASGTITIAGGRITATGGAGTGTTFYPGGIGGAVGVSSSSSSTYVQNTSGTIIFTGGSIYPTNSAGTVSVIPSPRNGTVNGNDVVGMATFPGYSSGDAFFIMAGGSLQSYPYNAIAHGDGNVYAWLAHPGITTDPATNVTANSATMNGTYYMNGTTISSAYFEYGTSTSYGNTETLTTPSVTTSGTIDTAAANLAGLSSNTTYHYRLVITVGSITVHGNDMTFTTKPVVDTLTAVPTGSSTATISGTIAAGNASISDVIITYATDAGFTANVVTLDGSSGVTFTDTTYTANITGLTSGQTYYVKVEAVGQGGTSDAKTGSFLAGGYPVTEKFVDLSGNPVDTTGLPDNTVIVTGSYTASGIPTSHITGGNTYTYLGYKLDSYTTGDALTSGTPSAVTITGNRDVYYVYAIAEGSIKIEKYDNGGTTLLPGAEFKVEKLLSSGGAVDTSFTALTQPATGGTTTFSNLPAGIYRVTETVAPANHDLLIEAFEVTIPTDVTLASGQTPTDTSYLYSTTSGGNVTYHYYDVTYKVSDQASIAMPAAGATGTFPPYALWGGGLILLAALSGGILWLKRRRAYAPKHG